MKESGYSLNRAIVQYAGKERKIEILFLVLLISFLLGNLMLFRIEDRYYRFYAAVEQKGSDERERAYLSTLASDSFLDSGNITDHIRNIEKLQATRADLEGGRMILYYTGVSLSELGPDILFLKQQYADVQVIQLEQKSDESRIVIEVEL